ncbi:MAG: M23 family metallopeptidase, partial [Planctomycetota bacterium]
GGCNWPYVGNHVNISHGGGISTFYGSLRNGSVSVTNGQRVRGGQQIGLAGSSGCSYWPRVFLEARGPGGIFDPNSGICNIPIVGWSTNIGKPTVPALNAFYFAKDTPPTVFPPDQMPTTGQIANTSPGLYYITMFSYIPANSNIRHRLLRPDGTAYYDYTHQFNNSMAYYSPWFYWGGTFGGPLSPPGTWTLKLDVNGAPVITAPLEVIITVNPNLNRAPNPITIAFSPAAPKVTDPITCRVTSAVVVNDLDYDIVRYRYRWLVNGVEVRNVISAGRADVLAHHVALDGQTVSCEVTPNDGKIDGPMAVISVAIAPTPNAIAYDSAVPFEKNSGILTTVNSISNASGMATLNLTGGIAFEQFSFGFSSNIPFTFPIGAILPGNSGSFVIDIASASFTNDPFDIFGPGGRAVLSVPFSPNPILVGQQFQLQWMAYDPAIGQIVLSHGLLVTVVP